MGDGTKVTWAGGICSPAIGYRAPRRGCDVDPTGFARRLRGSHDWRTDSTVAEEAIRRDPWNALVLAEALDAELTRQGFDLAVESMRKRILEIVSLTPGPEAARIAAGLAAEPPPTMSGEGAKLWRQLGAMRVVGSRSADEVLAMLTDRTLTAQDPEFALTLAHELVIRAGIDLTGEVSLTECRVAAESPLLSLPLRLLPCEVELRYWLPSFGGPASSYDLPGRAPAEPGHPLGEVCRGIGRILPVDEDRIAAPFREWVEASNGRLTIRRREKGDGYAAEEESPEPRLNSDRIGRVITAKEACGYLFSAGVSGGAYTSGVGTATARRLMWEAVAGLVGRTGDSIEALADIADEALWIVLETNDGWFYDVAWDHWILVETEGVVTTVAATDTD